MKTIYLRFFIISALMLGVADTACPQGTAFTYHGRLNENGIPANGVYNLIFSVFDAPNIGNQIGSTLTNTPVSVTNGLFNALLDFGTGVFTGADRWLEIGVSTNSAGVFTLLSPRQLLTPTPYAIMADTASNLLGSLPVDRLSGTLSDGQLSSNLARLDGEGTFTGAQTFDNPANSFTGSGAGLIGLNASHLTSGTVADARLSPNVALLDAHQTFSGANNFTGVVTLTNNANAFVGTFMGDGAALSNLIVHAANILGSLADEQLSTNVAQLNAHQTFSGSNTFNGALQATNADNVIVGAFSGNGSGLSGLNPANLAPGTAAISISGNAVTATSAATAGESAAANNFTGLLAGDVTGTQEDTVTSRIHGTPVSGTAPSVNQHLRYDGSEWLPGSVALETDTTGILADSHLSSNVGLLNANQTFSGSNVFSGAVLLTNTTNIFAGTFNGNGSNLTGLNPANLLSGTAAIDISGNAATATSAIMAGSATTANNFTGSLLGDVTGNQGVTVVADVGGQSAANVASGTSAANAATSANIPDTIVRRDGSGNFAAGAITAASVSGDGSGLTALDAGQVSTGRLADERLSPNVALLDGNQSFGGSNTFSGVNVFANATNRFVGTFSGDGSSLSNLVVFARNMAGPLPASQLVGPLPSSLLVGNYDNALTFTNPANVFGGNGAGLTDVNAAALEGLGVASFWQLGGNAGSIAGINFLGTIDNQPLEIEVNGRRAFRLEPTTNSPNIIGGFEGNYVISNVVGATIAGGGAENIGEANVVHSDYSSIGGGAGNTIETESQDGTSSGFGTIGGGHSNTLSRLPYGAVNSTIGGGYENTVCAPRSTIAGGSQNTIGYPSTRGAAPTYDCTIGGGSRNRIDYEVFGSTISGGMDNFLSCRLSTIAGGSGNSISGYPDTGNSIGGGTGNTIGGSQSSSTISGGSGNFINGGGGSVIGGGVNNSVTGANSVIPGGLGNTITRSYSFAAGYQAKATNQGSFVWAGGNTTDFSSTTDNSFHTYTPGGFEVNWGGQDAAGQGLKWIALASQTAGRVINVYNGAYLSEGGNWVDVSDRNAKENFEPVNTRDILEQVTSLPLTKWNYRKEDAAVRHLGPVAQDFHVAFGLGSDDKHISSLDSSGVALAAIQGLNEVVNEQKEELKQKAAEIQSLQKRLEALERAVLGRGMAQNGGGQ